MKTKAPPPTGATGATGSPAPAARVEGTTATRGVDATEYVDRADATAPTAPAVAAPDSSVDPVGQVAAQLRAGAITIERAVELLIEDAVQRQLGPTVANSRELESTLREMLRNYAETDPVLAARIRRLDRK